MSKGEERSKFEGSSYPPDRAFSHPLKLKEKGDSSLINDSKTDFFLQ